MTSYIGTLLTPVVVGLKKPHIRKQQEKKKKKKNMAATKTIQVPHLGGITAGYALSNDRYDPAKPTCVLINSMCTTVSLYRDQFSDAALTDAMNLLAIEPLGHGSTSCPSEHFTYWDSAWMALQVMDQLGIDKAFALGTSQGGWIVTRMALLAPDRVGAPASVNYLSCEGVPWQTKKLLTDVYCSSRSSG